MSRTVALVVGAAALLLFAVWFNAVEIASLRSQVERLEADVATQALVVERLRVRRADQAPRAPSGGWHTERPSDRLGERVRAAPAAEGSASPAVDLSDPDVRKEIEALVTETRARDDRTRRAEWARSMRAATRDEASAFATEKGLSPTRTATLLEELEGMHDQFAAVGDDIEQGELSWMDARAEFRAIREETAARLTTLLGADTFAEFEERVLPRGARRGGF